MSRSTHQPIDGFLAEFLEHAYALNHTISHVHAPQQRPQTASGSGTGDLLFQQLNVWCDKSTGMFLEIGPR